MDKLKNKTRIYLSIILGLVFLVSAMIYSGNNIAYLIKIMTSEHEYTSGVAIEFFGSRDITVTYTYVVNGKEYKSEMTTSAFSRKRRNYTVVYMKNCPSKSFLKEHLKACIIHNGMYLTMAIISFSSITWLFIKIWRSKS